MSEEINVTRSFLPPMEEYIEKIKKIWDSHILSNMGSLQCEFEDSLREYLKAPYCALLCNGHMALELLLQSMELSGEVITTPFTFASTTHAIVRSGLTPVFCDIHEDDYTIDEEKIESLITEKTTAILPVHVYGHICHVEKIEEIAKKHNLKVIYDAAHAFGVKRNGMPIGQYGDAVMFSFHATKPFHSIEGGAVISRDRDMIKKVQRIRNFGIYEEEDINEIGTNGKMNEFQAAMGLCNLKYLDGVIEKRQQIEKLYRKYLSPINDIFLPVKQCDVEENYAYFPIRIKESDGISRDELKEVLDLEGIHARKYFYPITSQLHCYKGKYKGDTPVAQKASREILTLPLYDTMSLTDVERICEIIIKYFNKDKG